MLGYEHGMALVAECGDMLAFCCIHCNMLQFRRVRRRAPLRYPPPRRILHDA